MAIIYSRGKKSVDGISGGLRFEQDNNRIIGRADDKKPNLIISSIPGESPLIEVARDGYDVTVATDDQLVMSSRFNLWKIIANGNTGYGIAGVYSRTGTLSLDKTTYLGYEHVTAIDTGIDISKALSGSADVLVNIVSFYGSQFANRGYVYHDGTNILWNHNYYYFSPYTSEGKYMFLIQRWRVLNGSYTFTPYGNVKQNINWSICNQTLQDASGGGVVGPLSGKYYYKDIIKVDKDGNIITPLASSTVEFLQGEWERWL